MNIKKFMLLEIVGVPIIYLLATFLHFVYDLTGGSTLSILFGSVNESVWEHIKIFAVGFMVWTIVEFLFAKPPFKKFVTVKVFMLYFLSLLIPVFFYTYNLFTVEPVLWLDLLSSFVFVTLTQYISYRLITNDNKISDYFPLALMLLMLYYLMFFSFTVFPPKIELFRDYETGMFGIIEDHIDVGACFMTKS
ncbi:MAG: hypothetical protein IJO20_08805 [Ruminococcus sp.]|nr:hypothetical protein [Ruminococcus sp.]